VASAEVGLHGQDLVQAPLVSLLTGKLGRYEGRYDLSRQLIPHDSRPEAQDVHVVVLHALVSRVRVVAHCRPDSPHLVCRDRRPNATAADEHAAVGAARRHEIGQRFGIVGVVVGGIVGIGPDIRDLMAKAL